MKKFPDRPAIYVLGNNEFYGKKLQKLIMELREMVAGTDVHLLEDDSFTIEDGVFLGATLWTDFPLNGDPVMSEIVAQTDMSDYRRIRTLLRYSRLKPSDTRRPHMESRSWLEDQLFSLNGSKVVIVTHHAPCPRSIPPTFPEDAFNPAFASDMSRFTMESKAKLWVHCHIHSASD